MISTISRASPDFARMISLTATTQSMRGLIRRPIHSNPFSITEKFREIQRLQYPDCRNHRFPCHFLQRLSSRSFYDRRTSENLTLGTGDIPFTFSKWFTSATINYLWHVTSGTSLDLSFNRLFLPLLFASLIGMKGEVFAAQGQIPAMMILDKSPVDRTIDESIELFNFLLEKGEEEAKKAKNKDIVIIFGNTGSGKSTLINFLYGCTMIKDAKGNIIASPESDLLQEAAQIGNDRYSSTVLPKSFKKGNQLVIDMPGLVDNRGIEVSLASIVAMKKIIENGGSVQFVMVFERNQIFVMRGQAWKEAVRFLEETFQKSLGSSKNSLCVLITKTQEDLSVIKGDIQKFTPDGSLDLSQFITVYDPLNPDDKVRLSKIINETTIYSRSDENLGGCK